AGALPRLRAAGRGRASPGGASAARYGNRRPELVRRFEAVPMLALEKDHFVSVLRVSLETLGKRFGFINANLRLVGVDDSAIDLLYDASREVCAYSEDGLRRIAFCD